MQQALSTWNSYVDLVIFRNSHSFSMWGAFFLWPLIWVSHVNIKKSKRKARNMGIPCKTKANSQQHGNPILVRLFWDTNIRLPCKTDSSSPNIQKVCKRS